MNINGIQSAMGGEKPMSPDNPRLKTAAHQFEASLMQEFLKPLQQDPLFSSDSSGGIGGGDGSDDGSGDDGGSSGALMSFGSEALAQAISERGGFGIATKILAHFRTQKNPADSANATKI